jgi:hypothetical protein
MPALITIPYRWPDPIEYRDVVGFPGYRVGNDGSVWSRNWETVEGGVA